MPVERLLWSSDITYVATQRGWLYLAVVLDLATRVVVGWATAPTLGEALMLRAWQPAVAARQPRRVCKYTQIPAPAEQANSRTCRGQVGRAFQAAVAVAGAVPT